MRYTTDKVTISLYSLQKNDGFDPASLTEINNIYKLKANFDREAKKCRRRPPEILLSVLLIPDWENDSSYTNPIYHIAKNNFIAAIKEKFHQHNLTDVILEDFYHDALSDPEYNAEKFYLEGLSHRNRNSDMIKTHAVISDNNRHRNHLQIDSNTRIYDFSGFYNATFNSTTLEEFGVKLYACRYSKYFICANNKVIYTTPGSRFAELLKIMHLS